MGLEIGLKKYCRKIATYRQTQSNAQPEKNGQTALPKFGEAAADVPPLLKRRASMPPLRQPPLLLSPIAGEMAASVSSLPPWEKSDAADFRSGSSPPRSGVWKLTTAKKASRGHDDEQPSPHHCGFRRRRTSSPRPPQPTRHQHNLPADHPGRCSGARARGALTRSRFRPKVRNRDFAAGGRWALRQHPAAP